MTTVIRTIAPRWVSTAFLVAMCVFLLAANAAAETAAERVWRNATVFTADARNLMAEAVAMVAALTSETWPRIWSAFHPPSGGAGLGAAEPATAAVSSELGRVL